MEILESEIDQPFWVDSCVCEPEIPDVELPKPPKKNYNLRKCLRIISEKTSQSHRGPKEILPAETNR